MSEPAVRLPAGGSASSGSPGTGYSVLAMAGLCQKLDQFHDSMAAAAALSCPARSKTQRRSWA